MSDGRKSILVVGDVMMDIVVRAEGPAFIGGDRRAAIRSLPGGSAANLAAWLGILGVNVLFAGRVGRADLKFHRAALDACGVNSRLAGDTELPTGTLVTMLSPDGERSFLTDRGANDRLCAEDLPVSLLDDVGLLHVSGYALVAATPRQAVLGLMAKARRRGIPISVDPPSYPFLREIGAESFLEWTSGADMIFPNAVEAEALAGTSDRETQLAALTDRYGLVVIKDGARGATAAKACSGERGETTAPAVDAVDTTGAGDAFLAGFLTAHLAGEGMETCLRRGVEVASRAVTLLGGRPPAEKRKASAPPSP